MIYTCYEMIRDCRENRCEGWEYFLSNYVPVIRRLLEHYAPGQAERLEPVLLALHRRDSGIFHSLDPLPERQFVAVLRQRVLGELTFPPSDGLLSLEDVAAALEPFTFLEKQAVWTETMRYTAAQAGPLLRMAPETIEKVRSRAEDELRTRLHSWRRGMLLESGIALGRQVAKTGTKECPVSKIFLDVLDGRTTWRIREELELHAGRCLYCVDHFCRLIEVMELLKRNQPLAQEDLEPFRKLLGIQAKPPVWKRWFRAS
jgi:hypothetical protein